MKIFGLNIPFTKAENISVNMPPRADIRKRITTPTQLYRSRQDIAKWRSAVTSAENLIAPQRYMLYQLYQDMVLDAHLSSAWMQRKNLTCSLDFDVIDKDGNENEELEYVLKSKWFRDFINYALDSKLYGHSLIQFDSVIDNTFKSCELVPREYVKPEFHIVTDNYSNLTGTDYLESPYRNWCIGVGDDKDLGLLLKLSPLVIWKKNALGAWSEFVEIFGTPIRIGKTNTRDEITRSNMEQMLKNMGVASYGVFDTDDLIELVESNRSDSFQVFDMMIQRCNSEISKLILGQTGTLDEKAFVGSAEVQERVLKMVGYADEVFIENVINDQLLPMMARLGIWDLKYKFKVSKEQEFTLEQKSKFDIELLKTGKFTFTADYIKENYGSEVIEVKEVDNSLNKVKNALEKYYK